MLRAYYIHKLYSYSVHALFKIYMSFNFTFKSFTSKKINKSKLKRHFECLAYKCIAPNFIKRVFAKPFLTEYIKFIFVYMRTLHKVLKPLHNLKACSDNMFN